MCGTNAVTVATSCQRARQEIIEVHAQFGDFLIIENRHGRDVALLVEVRDLPRR